MKKPTIDTTDNDVPLEEPPPVEGSSADIEGSLPASFEIRASLTRVHDILDHLTKQIDPAERISHA